MATPSLTRHRLPGALGEILVDVRAGGRQSARPAVVIVHGFKGFKDWGMLPPFAERLARAGFTAVSCNMSGSGVDDGGVMCHAERFAHATYSAELADVAGVVDALAAGQLGVVAPSAIGLVGHSRGGGMAVLHAAADIRIRALVTWAAIATVERWDAPTTEEWRRRGGLDIVNARTGDRVLLTPDVLDDIERHRARLDIAAAAARVAVPWLIAHGGADEAVPAGEARALADASARPTTELLLIPDAGHTFGAVHPWAGMTPALATLFDASLRTLARTLV